MSDARVQMGHLGEMWQDDYKYLPYVRQPVTSYEVETWKSMGYDYVKNFTGLMYDNRNIMPKWIQVIENAFGLYNQTYTFYKMETLDIMPVHVDHFRTYMKLFNVNYDQVYRVLLMLEDWKPGHYLEIDGVAYTNWKSGDWFKWKSDVPHAAANIGIEPRYTLQITGISVFTGQLNKLIRLGVPEVPDTFENSHPFFKQVILSNIPDSYKKPAMVYMNNRYIEDLNGITHTKTGTEIINKEGLKIYLWEPLCNYLIKDNNKIDHTYGFYSEFSHNIDYNMLRAEELDSILDYAKRNNLTNISVHTCDYNVSKYYPYYANQGLNLLTDDLFLKTQSGLEGQEKDFTPNFTKKFMCLNWRYTKHRHLLSIFLSDKSANISWYFKTSFEFLKNNLFFDLNSWEIKHPTLYNLLQSNLDLLNSRVPLSIDIPATEYVTIDDLTNFIQYPIVESYKQGTTPALYNNVKMTLSEYYSDIFVDIINETRFAQPTGNFSEKVFQSIQYKKPFILVAPPFTLEYVKSFGFKTFSDYWDESYDQEPDHEKRLIMIFNLINELNNKSIEELKELYLDMYYILSHNLKMFKQLFANPCYRMGENL